MKTIKQIAIIFAATVAGAALINTTAFAGAGGHAGDGVYVHGQLTMRDFIDFNKTNGGATLVTNTKQYLEQFSGFMPLLKDIGNADPALAVQIWNQLIGAQIWLTSAKLPLLPAACTTITGPHPQVQNAIRDGNQIMISTTAFSQLPEWQRPYELVHEALHGLLPGSCAPIAQTSVMYLTNYLHANRGHYTAEGLQTVTKELGINSSMESILSDMSFNHDVPAGTLNAAFEVYLNQQGTPSSLCVLDKELLNYYYTSDSGTRSFLNTYGPDNCSTETPLEALETVAPAITQIAQSQLFKTVSADRLSESLVGKYNNIYTDMFTVHLVNREGSYPFTAFVATRQLCRIYARPEIAGEIETAKLQDQAMIATIQQAKLQLAQIQAQYKNIQNKNIQNQPDLALTTALYLSANDPRVALFGLSGSPIEYTIAEINDNSNDDVGIVQKILAHLPSEQKTLLNNMNLCTEKYGYNYAQTGQK